MALEIEHKFLVVGDGWRQAVIGKRRLSQCYLSHDKRASVRVRVEASVGAWLTIKSAKCGPARSEYEYAIPIADAEAMSALAEGAVIEKCRHLVPHEGLLWEIDVFAGDNAGLIIAEIELPPRRPLPSLPDWIGREVTSDLRYDNASLAHKPFRSW